MNCEVSKREKRFIKAIKAFNKKCQSNMVVIYENPKDYPNKFVGRLWINSLPTEIEIVKDSVYEIRKMLPSYYGRIRRFINDDPVIVETWHW